MKQLKVAKSPARLIQVSVSATDETIGLLDALAANEGRTRSAQARHIITQAVLSNRPCVLRRNNKV